MTQEEMYPTVPGNPSTTLTAAYAAGTDTQINVVDGTQLPEAPNRVTIWSMDKTKLVTVKYLAKTGNILSDLTVEEGFPSNAVTKTFPAGSMAHCPLTSKAIMDMIANILDLYASKAELNHAERHGAGEADELELDASQIKTGIISIANLPKSVMERAIRVENDTARFALTTDTVQKGDSVKVNATNKLYFVVDDTKLNSEDGYMEYTTTPNDHGTTHLTGGGDAIPKATGTADGLMSMDDKTNLDSLVMWSGGHAQSYANTLNRIDEDEQTLTDHLTDTENPHEVTPTQIGLGKVNNTADADKVVKSAGKLTTATTVEGVTFDGSAAISHYAICSTAGSTAAKTVALTGYTLKTGARVIIGFSVANVAQNPTLNVQNTGAKPIVWMGDPVSADLLKAGAVYEMVYDGANYAIVGDLTRLKKPEVHGVLIDDTNSNPKTRVTIVGKSANWTEEERETEFQKHVRHCVMKAAQTLYYCDESDWSKKEDGTDSGVADGFALDGNFMLEHKTFWYRVTKYGEKVGLYEFTWDNPHEDGWLTPHAYADGSTREIVYTGVEEGTNSASYNGTTNCLRSVHGDTDEYKPVVNINNEVAYQRAQNTGLAEGLTTENNTYAIQQPLVTIMRGILKIWRYKTTDIQTNVARGIVDDGSSVIGRRPCGYGISLTGGNTQGTPASSQAYTDNTGACTCGAVNEHGHTWEHQGDMIYNGYGELAVATCGGAHLNITQVTAANYEEKIPESYARVKDVCVTSGYVKEMTHDPVYPLAPKAVGAGATTYYADYTYRNTADTAENHVPRCCLLGGCWSSASNAGAFYLSLNFAVGSSGSFIGARLQAHSLT